MVDLVDLCRVHRESRHPHQIAELFGDGVLLTRLVPLARLRAATVGLGYSFVPVETLPDIYEVLPLLLLPEILETKIIPYRRNVRPLLALAEEAPFPIFDEVTFGDISPLCLVHHESAHALVFEIARQGETEALPPRGLLTGTRQARRLVELLVESEGFALALDIFVAILAKVDHRASTHQLASISSPPNHMPSYDQKNGAMLRRLAGLLTAHPAPALRLLGAAAFIANLRPRATSHVSPALAERLSTFAGIPAGFEAEARELVSLGLAIDQAFRERVAPTLFRYCQIEAEFHAVLATPLETALAPGGSFDGHLARVAAALAFDRPLPATAEDHPTAR